MYPSIFVKRQFAPEYAQNVYETMLEEEVAVGQYLLEPSHSNPVESLA